MKTKLAQVISSLVLISLVAIKAAAAPPAAPQNVQPSWLWSGWTPEALLWWDAAPDATSYNLYYFDETNNVWANVATGLTEPRYRHSWPPAPPVRYVVTASNGDGESAPSAEVLVNGGAYDYNVYPMIIIYWPGYYYPGTVTPTTAQISWMVGQLSGADGMVELGTNGSELTVVMQNTNYQMWHGVIVTNLTPRTIYWYRITTVGTNRLGLSVTNWFATEDTNHPPVANTVSASTYMSYPIYIPLSGSDNASYVPDSIDSFRIIQGPTNGVLSATTVFAWNNMGEVLYSSSHTRSFEDHFWYVANDGEFDSAPALVTITNHFPNLGPQAGYATYSTLEGVPVPIELTGSDPNGDPITFELDTNSSPNGTVSGPLPNALYTPAPGFVGSDTLFYLVSDGSLASLGVIIVEVISTNVAPTALPQSLTVAEETILNITLTGQDANGDPLSFVITSSPVHGQLEGTPPVVLYRPGPFFNGTDQFSFTVNDGRAESPPATISITVTPVNDAPALTTLVTLAGGVEDTAQVIAFETLAAASDAADADGDPLVFRIEAVLSGSLTQNGQPTTPGTTLLSPGEELVWTPDANAHGAALPAFTVVAWDGQLASAVPVPVLVNVVAVNDPPTLGTLVDLGMAEDGTAITQILTGITTGAADEAQTLIVTAASSNPSLIPNPTVDYNSPNATGSLMFRPLANAHGSAIIAVNVSDGLETITRNFTVQVNAVNDAPTFDPVPTIHILEDAGPQVIQLTGISAGPADEPQALTVSVASTHESVTGIPALNYTSPNSTGTITLTPPANSFGLAVINVTLNDGLASTVRPIQINIDPVNDAPGANPQSVSTAYNIPTNVALTGSDVEGGALSYAVLTSPANGTLSGTAPNLTFTPNLNWSGTTSFTFRVSDGALNSATATVTITVSGPTSAPAAPNGLTATAVSRSRIDLAWDDNSTSENGFKVERSANGNSWTQIATVAPNVRNYSATGLSANKMYYFRVRAHNALGNSAYSNTASARTLP